MSIRDCSMYEAVIKCWVLTFIVPSKGLHLVAVVDLISCSSQQEVKKTITFRLKDRIKKMGGSRNVFVCSTSSHRWNDIIMHENFCNRIFMHGPPYSQILVQCTMQYIYNHK